MSASPKTKRLAPDRNFDDYVVTLTSLSDDGLFPVQSANMTYLPGVIGTEFSAISNAFIDIGFNFVFDGKTYTKLCVSSCGFCVLVDPSISYASTAALMGDVLDVAASFYRNTTIKTTITGNNIVVAPWWDFLRNVFRYPKGANQDLYFTSLQGPPLPYVTYSDVISGKFLMPSGIDSTLGGVKYFRANSTQYGKALAIRWKSFSVYGAPGTSENIITFDLIIYNSGMIEFRYSPRSFTGINIEEAATIGIFKNNTTYRDFGQILKTDDTNARPRHVNGGASWNSSFTDYDSAESDYANYTVSLNTFEHWPAAGTDKCAIFRFSPPSNRRTQNRTVLPMRAATPFIRGSKDSSVFNDQKTIPFSDTNTNQLIEYPSMIPASMNTAAFGNPYTVADLFRSGSIQISRVTVPACLSDSILSDSIIDGKRRSGQ